MINWKVRVANKNFWVAFVPAVVLLLQTVAGVFGFELDLTDMQGKVLAVVDALFMVLAVIGVVNDPTTAGLVDSNRAMGYEVPYEDKVE